MDFEGDKSKQPPECKDEWIENKEKPSLSYIKRCPHIKDGYGDFELERYKCDVCEKSYTLYYEDMA